MNIDENKVRQLAQKYLNGTASDDEKQLLHEWYDTVNAGEIEIVFTENPQTVKSFGLEALAELKKMIAADKNVSRQPAVIRMFPVRWAAAASVIMILGLSYYFIFLNNHPDRQQQSVTQLQGADVNPGAFKAKLTLSDGSTIVLDSSELVELTKQGNTSLINKNGKLQYDDNGTGGDVLYNTVSTANGETYSLILADGSTVTLNSSSSVRFPVAFPGSERRIEITGEAYFKVSKNVKQPFIVTVKGMNVQVLGTEFNINAYDGENVIAATLIEGSVKVFTDNSSTRPASSVILNPNQQAQLAIDKLKVFSDVNMDEVIAWKEGKFYFESADLKTILKQFSRWYDIEVIYEGRVSNEKFFSIINRNTALSNVLKSLQANGINFKIEGKKLFVQSE